RVIWRQMAVPSSNPLQLPSRDVLRVLGDNTRYAIYLELARSPRPLVTAEIAETLGLHPNTVRPHLERMREVGLLDVEADARGTVRRPEHRYSVAARAPPPHRGPPRPSPRGCPAGGGGGGRRRPPAPAARRSKPDASRESSTP